MLYDLFECYDCNFYQFLSAERVLVGLVPSSKLLIIIIIDMHSAIFQTSIQFHTCACMCCTANFHINTFSTERIELKFPLKIALVPGVLQISCIAKFIRRCCAELENRPRIP